MLEIKIDYNYDYTEKIFIIRCDFCREKLHTHFVRKDGKYTGYTYPCIGTDYHEDKPNRIYYVPDREDFYMCKYCCEKYKSYLLEQEKEEDFKEKIIETPKLNEETKNIRKQGRI